MFIYERKYNCVFIVERVRLKIRCFIQTNKKRPSSAKPRVRHSWDITDTQSVEEETITKQKKSKSRHSSISSESDQSDASEFVQVSLILISLLMKLT